ncbi:hypothetical protein NQ176_g7051 [Zarea fungicola]|uniref:Uncharacterized protein n=1 Tax=Zarea fungicola TaxID=93591 RepID=A0ACC1N2B2_9HYPO|nr:hypothetical protein NQ176_g7051 [Lecanicillium fungicola]
MAYSRINHPDFGTREEDWPELDIDSDAEDYHEKVELAEAAFSAVIHRSVAKRNHRPAYPNIPASLYLKAEHHQDQLTTEERHLLLSRGDLIGKALGDPASLTAQEIHQLFLWPPPDVVHATIQRATGGRLTTPTELYAKMKEAIDRGELETTFSDEAIRLPARKFHALDDATFNPLEGMKFHGMPGRKNAFNLVHRQQGLDLAVFQASAIYTVEDRGDVEKQPAWKAEYNKAFKDMRNSVPEAVNIISGDMQVSQRLHANGRLSDRDYVARIWEHLAGLKLASGPQPIPHPALRELIGSMSSLQQRHEQSKASIEEVIQCNMLYLDRFGIARRAEVKVDFGQATIKVSSSDRSGTGDWPPGNQRLSPYRLYLREASLSGPAAKDAWSAKDEWAANEAWAALSEAERAAYRAQVETLRLAAWDQHQARVAEGISTLDLLPSIHHAPVAAHESQPEPHGPRQLPEQPQRITGFHVYREELDAGVQFEDAFVRWRGLTGTQKDAYDAEARERDKAAKAEYQRAFDAFINRPYTRR